MIYSLREILMKNRSWLQKAGKTFNDDLDRPILVIGRLVFSKRTMIEELRCGNFSAARRLDSALENFRAKTVETLARTVSIDDLFAIDGVGEATVHVWMCVLDYIGIDPLKWLDRKVTIPTLYAKSKLFKK